MNTDEMTIDLMDLLRRCVMRWKFIVIWMLIGAIVMDGVGILRSVKKVKNAKAQIAQQGEEEDTTEKLAAINEYMQQLTSREVSEVQTAVLSYKAYQQEYVDCLKYYQESMKMKLDPSCVPTLRLQYIIDNHYEVTYPVIDKKDTTQDIISVLAEKVKSESVSNAVAEALDNKVSAAYVQELITTSVDDSNQTSVSGNDAFIINIVAEDREKCEKIAEIVKNTIDENLSAVREICGGFDIKLASEQTFEISNKDLMSAQQSAVTSLNSLKSSINNLPYGMTDDQKTYYYALLDNDETVNLDTYGEDDENTEDKLEVPEIVVPQIQYVNIKYLLLGLILGAIVACGWVALKYLLSAKLRVTGDITEVFEMNVLGNVAENGRKIPKLFRKPYHDVPMEKQLQVITSRIQVMAEKEKMTKIFVTGSAMTDCLKILCEKLSNELEEDGVVCFVGDSVLYDPMEVKRMADADGVVFIEQIDVSRYDEIAEEKKISARMHMEILGCVVVE